MATKKEPPVWCVITFHSSNTPKRFEDVRRMYTKAGWFCVELPDKDPAGRPIIKRYPMLNIFDVASPHPDHIGAEER